MNVVQFADANPAAVMYFGVPIVGIIGAAMARLQPDGMACALFATALPQALVLAVALIILITRNPQVTFWAPAELRGFGLNAFFVMPFVGSALLYRKAARGESARRGITRPVQATPRGRSDCMSSIVRAPCLSTVVRLPKHPRKIGSPMKMKALVLFAAVAIAVAVGLIAHAALPVGDSSAVFRAVDGDNSRKIVLLQFRAGFISPDGGMLDPWGKPYKIYFPGKEPLIRAGSISPDGGMLDPWGNPYKIYSPGKVPLIHS